MKRLGNDGTWMSRHGYHNEKQKNKKIIIKTTLPRKAG